MKTSFSDYLKKVLLMEQKNLVTMTEAEMKQKPSIKVETDSMRFVIYQN